MRKGRALEKLVALIEERLAGSPGVKVESPGHLPDRVTGKPREHDVLLTIDQGHHRVLIALECRDRARPVGVPQVEAFHTKCEDTGINQGIMVSPSGFYRTAIAKAHHYGIRCLSLEQAGEFKWLLAPNIAMVNLELKHTNWTVVPLHPPLDPEPLDFTLVDSEGNEITTEILNANVLRRVQSSPPGLDAGPKTARLVFNGEGTLLRDNKTGKKHLLKQLIADSQFELRIEFAPFRLLKYAEEGSTAAIAEAAVADITAGPIQGQFVAVRAPSGETTVSFVKSQVSLPKSSSGA